VNFFHDWLSLTANTADTQPDALAMACLICLCYIAISLLRNSGQNTEIQDLFVETASLRGRFSFYPGFACLHSLQSRQASHRAILCNCMGVAGRTSENAEIVL